MFISSLVVYKIESVLPVCDKPYHKNNEFQQMWAEIKQLWNYALQGLQESPTDRGRNVPHDIV